MKSKNKFCVVLLVFLASVSFAVQTCFAYSGVNLSFGMSGKEILSLQKDLKTIGIFNSNPTGYFGIKTKVSVVNFQQQYKLSQDGVAGIATQKKIDQLLGREVNISRSNSINSVSSTSRSNSINSVNSNSILLLPWFSKADNIFAIGKTAHVIDVKTGIGFYVKRTYGYNHADVETLSLKDTQTLLKIIGGYWNWTRRPIIVETEGVRIAASMAPMPHAGIDSAPANSMISTRSGGYGYGANLDAIKSNEMDGVFDIHFYQSRTHGSNRVDEMHQKAVQAAYHSGM